MRQFGFAARARLQVRSPVPQPDYPRWAPIRLCCWASTASIAGSATEISAAGENSISLLGAISVSSAGSAIGSAWALVPISDPDADLFSHPVKHLNELRHDRGSCSRSEIQLQRQHREFFGWRAVEQQASNCKEVDLLAAITRRQFAVAVGRGYRFEHRSGCRNIEGTCASSIEFALNFD